MGEFRRKEDAVRNMSQADRRKLALGMVIQQLNRVFNGDAEKTFPVSFVLLTFSANPLAEISIDSCLANCREDRVRHALEKQLSEMKEPT